MGPEINPPFDRITAVHMVHVYHPDWDHWGRFLVWGYGHETTHTTPLCYLWTPPADGASGNGTFEHFDNDRTDLFCCGHCQLPDSNVLTSGGHFLPPNTGETLRLAPYHLDLFDVAEPEWRQGNGSPPPPPDMFSRRWYPTCTRLSSGDVYIMGGDWSLSPNTKATLCELFRSGRTWLRGFTFCESSVEYPFNYLLPTGSATVDKLFRAGPTPGTAIIDVDLADPRDPAVNGPFNAEHPEEVGATSVMWEPGKVIKFGGAPVPSSGTPTPDAVTKISRVDMTATTPAWSLLQRSMNKERMNANAVQLPDRTIAVIGGNAESPQSEPVLTAEFIDPRLDGSTGQWPETAGNMAGADGRTYHSTAGVLCDSRVIVAGGEDARKDAQFLKPPYLAATVWPMITQANGGQHDLVYNTTFEIQFVFDGVSEEGYIDRVVLLGLNAVTHGFDQNQRYLELEIVSRIGSDRLVVRAPVNARLAPPGWYMLFIVANTNVPAGASGVPCRNARYVKIGA